MNKHLFLICWSLISPGCLGLLYAISSASQTRFSPGDGISLLTITPYLVYWILVGILQARLIFWKFQNQQFAKQWFLLTSITGSLVMLSHDIVLAAMGIEAVGQGATILIISMPILAICGGLILGFMQFLSINNYYYQNNKSSVLRERLFWLFGWLIISLLSWIIGFGGAYFTDFFEHGIFFFVAIGTTLKGLFISNLKPSSFW